MNTDLLVVGDPKDRTAAAELSEELDHLGVEVEHRNLRSGSKLRAQLKTCAKSYSSVVLLVTENLIARLERSKCSTGRLPPSIIRLGYRVPKSMTAAGDHVVPGVRFLSVRSLRGVALEVVRVLADDGLKLSTSRSTSQIWRSPLYVFRRKVGFGERDFLIDVTWSAKPTRPETSESLQTALRACLDFVRGELKRKPRILDFGAGKLRHTLFLLDKGFAVTAVDYAALFRDPTEQTAQFLAAARRYRSFGTLVYPSDFLTAHEEYDLVLLINVLNIMPEPLERLFVLDRCNRQAGRNGYVLWYCQYGDAYQIEAASEPITDGGCTTGKGRKTFYTDYNDQEFIIRTMGVMGFERVDDVKPRVGKNHALLFKRTRKPVIDIEAIIRENRQALERVAVTGQSDSEVAVADVLDGEEFLGLGGVLAAALDRVRPGHRGAHSFENLVKPIVEHIFEADFIRATMEKQYAIQKRRKRIDLKADWRTSSDIKTLVTQDNGQNSNYVPIECKNYSGPLSNPEFAQIVDRCALNRQFAIVICRDVKDREEVTDQCFLRWDQHRYLIVVLDDSDLKQLLVAVDHEEHEEVLALIRRRIEEVVNFK